MDKTVPAINFDTNSYDPLNPFHTRQSVDIMPVDIINLDNHSDLDNSLMASFANIPPVNLPTDYQSDVSEYLPNSEYVFRSLPPTMPPVMISTISFKYNTTSTLSRKLMITTDAQVRPTQDTRPYINSFLRNDATKESYVSLFDYVYDDETKCFDSLATLKLRPWLIEKRKFYSVVF